MAQISDQQYQYNDASIPAYNKRILDLRNSQTSGYADTLSKPTPTDPSVSAENPSVKSDQNSQLNALMDLMRQHQSIMKSNEYQGQQQQALQGVNLPSSLLGASPSQQNQVLGAQASALQPTISGAKTAFSDIGDIIGNVKQWQEKKRVAQNDLYKRIRDDLSANPDAYNNYLPQELADLEKEGGMPKGSIEAYRSGVKAQQIQNQKDKLELARVQSQQKFGTDGIGSLASSREALTISRYTMASNRIVNNYIKLPAYQLLATAQPYLLRVESANEVPGSVSDNELLDSIIKLNTGGNAVTEAQVSTITKGKSLSDTISVWNNYLAKGGVLSDQQRKDLTAIAQKVYANYKKSYQPIYNAAVKQLRNSGIPEQYWTLPNLNSLSAVGGSGQRGGRIRVKLKSTGGLGTLDSEDEFDPNLYERL